MTVYWDVNAGKPGAIFTNTVAGNQYFFGRVTRTDLLNGYKSHSGVVAGTYTVNINSGHLGNATPLAGVVCS